MKKTMFSLFLLFMIVAVAEAGTETGYSLVTAPSGLSMRTEPGQNADRELVIPYQTRVQVVALSDKSETISGVKGKWVKVQWLDYSGWVFDAYLKTVSQDDPLVSYIRFCDSLDVNDIDSITKAKNTFRKSFLSRPELQEHAFRVFRHLYKQAGYSLQSRIESDNRLTGSGYVLGSPLLHSIDPDHLSAGQIKKLKEELQWYEGDPEDSGYDSVQRDEDFRFFLRELVSYARNGIQMDCGEGESFVRENYHYYVEEVLRGCKGEIVAYFTVLAQNDSHQLSADAGYLISWEEMRANLIAFERFYLKHPKFFESRDLPGLIETRLYAYLWGADNTPLTYSREDPLLDEVMKSYQRFLTENQDSKFTPYMKRLYRLYQTNDFKTNKEIEDTITHITREYQKILEAQ